jgi:predicted RNA-binding protein with TRAM domain
MKTDIRTSTLKSRNIVRIKHLSDPAGPESKLRERETGSGLIPGMEETAATSK